MKEKYIKYFIDVATRTAELSYARRLKVGAVIVRDDRVISVGYNGTAPGEDNNCEIEEYNTNGELVLTTKPCVLHAELNCITHCCRCGQPTIGTIMFLTHAPCMQCSLLIFTVGIQKVYYNNVYKSLDGVKFLEAHGIPVIKI